MKQEITPEILEIIITEFTSLQFAKLLINSYILKFVMEKCYH